MLLIAATFAAEPDVTIRWKGGSAELIVRPPPGEHINADAPARWQVGDAELRGKGAMTGARLPAPKRGDAVRAEVPLCLDDASGCRVVSAWGTVDADTRAGTLSLAVGAPPSSATVARGRVARVYDFGAVWCPPCNRMRAEVVDAPAHAEIVAALGFEMVDVDLPESWPLKDRYRVGGYPTLVAVDDAGNEVDRYVGYAGEASLLAWCAGLATVAPLSDLAAGPPAGVSPEAAGAAALRLARVQHEAAAQRWLAVAGDSRDAHVARLVLDPQRPDVDWLLAHDPGGDWAPLAVAAFPDLWPRLAPAVALASPDDIAGALDAWAATAPADAALAARLGVLGVLRARLTDDPAHDRGFIVDYTDALAATGNLPAALAVLDRYAALYPAEFTFHFTATRLLLEGGRAAEADARARAALALAWGDQRLRAVGRLARALAALDRRPEAIAALEAELAAAQRPAADQQVRTHRYLRDVEVQLTELRGGK
jgi:thiol-disulfide isomerase/thioredoxin